MALLAIDGVAIQSPSSFTWGLQDVSRNDAGRDESATMHKNRVAQKVTLDLEWTGLTLQEAHTILVKFQPEYIDVTYYDPLEGTDVTNTFYTGDKSAPVQVWTVNKKYYSKLSFNLIER